MYCLQDESVCIQRSPRSSMSWGHMFEFYGGQPFKSLESLEDLSDRLLYSSEISICPATQTDPNIWVSYPFEPRS